MNKYIIYIIAALIVVSGGWFLLQQNRPDGGLAPDTVAEETQSSELSDGSYQVPAGSDLNWMGKKPLISGYEDYGKVEVKEGSFKVEGGEINSGRVVLDMASISTDRTGKEDGSGGDMLTRHLKSADFFDVERFPEAVFVINEASSTESGVYAVKGMLTVKDVSRPVEFQAYSYQNNGQDMLKGGFTIDRTEWNIKYGSGKFFSDLADRVIDDSISLSFDFPVYKQQL